MSENTLNLIILLPLAGAFIIGILGFLNENFRKAEKLIGAFGTAMVAIPFFIILAVFLNFDGKEVTFSIMDWIPLTFGDKRGMVDFGYSLDHLSLIMGLVVTGVGSLIHVYSIGYMHGDRGYYKFFLYLNLFIFAMLNLILGDNMVVMFLGWEGVGACSYFLIGFWYEDMPKAAAAQKAFVANRIGDFAMLVAMFMIYNVSGTLNFDEIASSTFGDSGTWIAVLIFIAATGKSAQIPLFVWLPDAMAGPTPVSALIHAATMVTSGIYLIARMSTLYVSVPAVMAFICVVGALTALIAALTAVAQNDIKKVLAYSTVSQLGFMFMALGAGAFTTAIFHVMTHAFFKACLFLGSGSVIHAMDHMHTVEDPQDIRTMGGLKKYMPATRITFLISTIAIAGIPGLSGFFSKDEIMGKVFFAGWDNWVYFLVFAVGMFTALLTAFYMTRVYYLTFEGEERFPDTKKPHESPALMTVPLYVLAGLAIVGGWVGIPEIIGHGKFHFFNQFLGHNGPVDIDHINGKMSMISNLGMIEIGLIIFSIFIAVFGVWYGWNLYSTKGLGGDDLVKAKTGKFYDVMSNKFYFDEIYDYALIKPFVAAGEQLIMAFDKNVLDGIVNGTAKLIHGLGDSIKKMQTGLVSNYALYMVIGLFIIMTYLLIW